MGRLIRRVLFTGRFRDTGWTAISLGTTLPQPSSGLPGNGTGSPIVPCLTLLRTRFTEPTASPRSLVGSYPTVSPLPGACAPGGLLSVALSRGLPRVGVTHRPALWSPDVPRRTIETVRRDRLADPLAVQVYRRRPGPDRRGIRSPTTVARSPGSGAAQRPDSSVRTRMRSHSGHSTTSSGAERRTDSRSEPVSVMPQPPQVRARRSAAPTPPPRTRRCS